MRVAIADDSVLFRTGLTALLTAAGVEVACEVATTDTLLATLALEPVDVAILDIRMPPTWTNEGIVAARHVRQEYAGVAVLVLSTYSEPSYALDLLSAGDSAIGYLLKDRVGSIVDLVDALHRVHAGEIVIDPLVVRQLLLRREPEDIVATLTNREQAILRLMAEGRSNSNIGQQLFLSVRTVEHHIASVFNQLGLEPDAGDNRRVLAVLTWLRGRGASVR